MVGWIYLGKENSIDVTSELGTGGEVTERVRMGKRCNESIDSDNRN